MALPNSFGWLAWHRSAPSAPWRSLRHGPTVAACWAAVAADPAAGEWCVIEADRGQPQAGDEVTVYEAVAVATRTLTAEQPAEHDQRRRARR